MKVPLTLGVCFALVTLTAGAQGTPWRQAELTENLMKSLTMHQCMEKTIASLKTDCKSNSCLITLGGISGDCIALAKGDRQEFCNSFEATYLRRYCWSNDLDARSCMFLTYGNAIDCKQK